MYVSTGFEYVEGTVGMISEETNDDSYVSIDIDKTTYHFYKSSICCDIIEGNYVHINMVRLYGMKHYWMVSLE